MLPSPPGRVDTAPLLKALRAWETRYDPAAGLISGVSGTQGYHTALPTGSPVHPTRDSATYARGLLAAGEEAGVARGLSILEKLLALQDTDPLSPWYGIWGWFSEEPPPQMNPADWNWADFMGAILADILLESGDLLPPELEEGTRRALGHAAWSIFRRNVSIDYTNIAAMGGAVTMAAGRILADARLADYGRRRIRRLREHVEANSGFPEYNSPTYTAVAIEEFERVIALATEPEARADAEALRVLAWKLTAEHFHPPTGQWAGPQSRAYSDWLQGHGLRFLERRLGFSFVRRPLREQPSDEFRLPLDHAIPCPEGLRARFEALPETPFSHRHVWTRDRSGRPSTVSTTWFGPEATLGSVNREITWAQPHPIVGFWRTAADVAARVRLRVLFDGRDFAGGLLRNAQVEAAILSSVQILTNEGTFHPHFDKPPDGVYSMRDLRVRCEVEGVGASIAPVGEKSWALTVNGAGILFQAGPAWFGGKPAARWETGTEGDKVWIDGILHTGEERPYDPARSLETLLTCGLAWVPEIPPELPVPPCVEKRDGYYAISWAFGTAGLALQTPQPAVRNTER